jgi:hypothetical protein
MHEEENDDSPAQGRLSDLLMKVLVYQYSLPDGRAVELEELQREGVFGPEEIKFMRSHSVTYKPHRLPDFHGMDMFHMPTEGGCVFMGPPGAPLKKRGIALRHFGRVVEDFLRLPRPDDDLLLHVEFEKEEEDGMGVARESICFTFGSEGARERLPRIREVAAGLGLRTTQDEDIQRSWILSFGVPWTEAERTSAAVVALLRQGCGFVEEAEVIYSAGALDDA